MSAIGGSGALFFGRKKTARVQKNRKFILQKKRESSKKTLELYNNVNMLQQRDSSQLSNADQNQSFDESGFHLPSLSKESVSQVSKYKNSLKNSPFELSKHKSSQSNEQNLQPRLTKFSNFELDQTLGIVDQTKMVEERPEQKPPDEIDNAIRKSGIIKKLTMEIVKKQNETAPVIDQKPAKTYRLFEYFILLIILMNSLALALYDYSDRDSNTLRNQVLDVAGTVFTYIFLAECLMKIIAYGLVLHKDAYLRDGWNIIDFLVVLSGLLEEILGGGTIKLKSLRVLRVLRPLRSINSIPSMKKLVGALLQALPDFLHVAVFLIFIFILFAILGIHQYNGIFYNRCRINQSPENANFWQKDLSINRVCSQNGLGNFQCPANQYCGNPTEYGISLQDDMVYYNPQINFGITTFNNLPDSLLTVLIIVLADDWTKIMLNIMDADLPYLAAFYCILIIVVGSFFLMNLILAVIIQAFISIQRNEIESQIVNLDTQKQDELRKLNIHNKEPIPEITEQKSMIDSRRSSVKFNSRNNLRCKSIPLTSLEQMTKRDSQIIPYEKRYTSVIVDQFTPNENGEIQERVADFSFLKKLNQQNKILKVFLQKSPNDYITQGTLNMSKSKSAQDPSPDNMQQIAFQKPTLEKKEITSPFENFNFPDIQALSKRGSKRKLMESEIKPSHFDVTNNNYNESIDDLIMNTRIPTNSRNPETQKPKQVGSEELKVDDTFKENQSLESLIKMKKQELKDQQQQQSETPENKETSSPNRLQDAFRSMIKHKQDEEIYKRDEYFNKILIETKKDYMNKKNKMQNKTTIRQLATVRLGLKIKRQKGDISKEVEKFKIEDRAESNKLYLICYKISMSPKFTTFISLLIIFNTIVLAMDRHPIKRDQLEILDKINLGFSSIFLIEMVIKLFGLGFKAYFKDQYNLFDCIIVISSIVDFFVSSIILESGGAITALRAFRLIRIFKLAKSWKRFQNLLKTMGRTLKDISTFSILLFLFMFTYSLLGMEMFAYKKSPDNEDQQIFAGTPLRANFDEFGDAITTVFIVLTNDSWTSIYYKYWRMVGSISTLFFVTLIIIGQKVLLNLFLAILLENFDEESLNQEIKDQIKKKAQEENKQSAQVTWFNKFKNFFEYLIRQRCPRIRRCRRLVKKAIQDEDHQDSSLEDMEAQDQSKIDFDEPSLSSKSLVNTSMKEKPIKRKSANKFVKDTEPKIYGISLQIFNQKNKFREVCFSLVTNVKFDYIIIFFIMVSGVQLALENPLNDPNSKLIGILTWIDISTTIIFCLEALLKIIAFGFAFNGKSSYLRNSWNALDFAIIILSVMSLTPLSNDLKIFKMFRVVRGLRLVSKNEGLQLAVKALVSAIPQIANVTIIMLLFFLIFGIIAISYFKGKFYYCYNDNIHFINQLAVNSKWDCLNLGGSWINRSYSFDNIFIAMMTLFQMSTTEGWSEIMFTSTSATDIDYVQVQNNNQYWVIFFIAFIVVGSFFLLNLFVGVVISTFNRQKDRIGGNNLLTERQKEWIDTKLIALRAKPIKLLKPPENKFRKICFKIQENKWFERIIFVCIIINTIVLCLKWHNQPDVIQTITDALNQFFTAIFALEALIKILGLGKQYFKENWNIFDFIIVIGSILSVFLTFISSFSIGGATTIIRAFRISRVFRLVKRAKNLRLVFNTFIFTLPALANVGGLLLLLLYLYSIVGVNLFSEVKRNGILSETLNFENFGNSFITLFAVATGDGWSGIVAATYNSNSIVYECIENPTYEDYLNNNLQPVGCGAGFSGIVFFYSYILFVNIIFLNLFIAIILQGFDDTMQKDNRLFNQETQDHFRQVWSKYDPDATTYVKISALKDILFDLGLPLGWDETYVDNIGLQDKFIAGLDLPIYNNFSDYRFLDVLEALALRLVVQELIAQEKEKIKKEKEQEDSLLNDSQEEQKSSDIEKKEQELKNLIEKDLNKLEFQESVKQIQAVKEMERGIRKNSDNQGNVNKDGHFTSLHQAAAQVAVSHMKYIVAKKKFLRQIEEQKKQQLEKEDKNQSSQSPFQITLQEVNDAAGLLKLQENNQRFDLRNQIIVEDFEKSSSSNSSKSADRNRLEEPQKNAEIWSTFKSENMSEAGSFSQSSIIYDGQRKSKTKQEIKYQESTFIKQRSEDEKESGINSSEKDMNTFRVNKIIDQELEDVKRNSARNKAAHDEFLAVQNQLVTPIQKHSKFLRKKSREANLTNQSQQQVQVQNQINIQEQRMQIQVSSNQNSDNESQGDEEEQRRSEPTHMKPPPINIKFGGSVGGTDGWENFESQEDAKNQIQIIETVRRSSQPFENIAPFQISQNYLKEDQQNEGDNQTRSLTKSRTVNNKDISLRTIEVQEEREEIKYQININENFDQQMPIQFSFNDDNIVETIQNTKNESNLDSNQ